MQRLILLLTLLATCSAHAGDWPAWRYDAQRSASSPHALPGELQHRWTIQLSPRQPAWGSELNRDLLSYDRSFEPIIVGGRMIVSFNDRDKVTAFDMATGAEAWTVFAGGPVRLPPVAWENQVYFCSDDGHLYCVAADSGNLLWRFRGAPASQKALGNRRLISAWPARGGPVVRDGTVYFAASIWPFMGTFIYALDAHSGAVQWVNDSTGSQYIAQPHTAPSFAGVAPQGALVVTEKWLIVPGGRSVPAVFDRRTGEFKYFHINAGGKGTGGSFVAADNDRFFVHTRGKGVRGFNLETGVKTALLIDEPVLSGDLVYTSAKSESGKSVVRAYDRGDTLQWQLAVDSGADLIQAGTHLYVAGSSSVSTIQLDAESGRPHVVWQTPIDGQLERLLAGSDHLVAVFADGRIAAYGGPSQVDSVAAAASHRGQSTEPAAKLDVDSETSQRARNLLVAGETEGYALWFGVDDERLLGAVVAQSEFVELAIVDADPVTVNRLRHRYDRAGRYGAVTVHAGTPRDFSAPPYIAHRVFVSASLSQQAIDRPEIAQALYRSVRPYGGQLHLTCDSSAVESFSSALTEMGLECAAVTAGPDTVSVTRVGQLPGAADWTHQHGDISNSVKSNDSRVKLPLGVLWFGGNGEADVLPRHGHGPPEQVVGGRLFIEGFNSLSARDVYTGRELWQREFEDLGTYDVYYDATFRDAPLDPSYNQVHIPGANARGTNYVATADRLYVVEKDFCQVLDPATGETLQVIRLPADEDDGEAEWGFIGVYEDVLIGGAGFANYARRHALSFEKDKELKKSRAGFGSKSYDRAASAAIIGFDRHTGEVLWRQEARHSFWHNGIVAGNGHLFCLDRNPRPVEDALRRRGLSPPSTYRIVAFDIRSGTIDWEREGDVFGTWLGYSAQFDLLLQAGAAGSDRLAAETTRGMAVYRGGDGAPQWKNETVKYSGPCILHNDTILTNVPSRKASAGAFSLLDGSPKFIQNPLTGESQLWTIARDYGCNNVIASENLLTFRSGAAGFYDLLSDSGTGNLGGFKSGCTSNLVVADGVLNAPDYTLTCSCAYQNQTSLALVHMPDVEMWAVNHMIDLTPSDKPIESLGINFGAPGDRRDSEGTMWIEFPEVSGEPTKLQVEFEGDPSYFHRHSSALASGQLPWVQASGISGPTKIRISLGSQAEPAAYQVRLYFGNPNKLKVGACVFDIDLQGQARQTDFDLAAEAGEALCCVKQFDNVVLNGELEIGLSPTNGVPALSGISLLRQAPDGVR